MFNQDILEEIKKVIKEFFEKITFEIEIEFLPQRDSILYINLKEIEEPQILIGERGETLLEIQHLLKLILKKKLNLKEHFYIDLDINNYKKKKNIYLRELAKSLAGEVSLTKREKVLPPMSSYERKIIHLELASYPGVITESFGQEPKRKIIIKPYP